MAEPAEATERDPLHHLSVSGADTFEDCPRRWHGKYVLQVPDPSGPEATVGTMAHVVLERLGVFPPGRRTLGLAQMLANRLWADRPPELRRPAMGHVIRALHDLDVTHGDAVLVEAKLETTLGRVPFVGRLDRADSLPSGALNIIDYKTGKRKPGRNNVYLEPKRRQVTLYAAAVESIFGRPVQRVSILWTESGRVDEWDVGDVEMAEAVRWLRHVWDDLNDAFAHDDFPAKPGHLCSWCSLVNGCPEGRIATLARYEEGKSIGPYGVPVVEDVQMRQWSDTVDALHGSHLRVVDGGAA